MPEEPSNTLSPTHYSRFKIQPLDFIAENSLDFLQGNIIKYVCRYDAKNGLEDLQKARVYLDRLIEKSGGSAQALQPEAGSPNEHLELMYCASTVHIPASDSEILARAAFNPDTGEGSPYIFQHDAGFFVFIPVAFDGDYLRIRTSGSFFDLCMAAKNANARWLNLDKEAPQDKQFQIYDW